MLKPGLLILLRFVIQNFAHRVRRYHRAVGGPNEDSRMELSHGEAKNEGLGTTNADAREETAQWVDADKVVLFGGDHGLERLAVVDDATPYA